MQTCPRKDRVHVTGKLSHSVGKATQQPMNRERWYPEFVLSGKGIISSRVDEISDMSSFAARGGALSEYLSSLLPESLLVQIRTLASVPSTP